MRIQNVISFHDLSNYANVLRQLSVHIQSITNPVKRINVMILSV
jgi:hypothetical protein